MQTNDAPRTSDDLYSQRVHSICTQIKVIALIVICGFGIARGQVGPYPDPIVENTHTESKSESVRFAMDELLLDQATRIQSEKSSGLQDDGQRERAVENILANDLNTGSVGDSNSIPLGQPTRIQDTNPLGGSSDQQSSLTDGWLQTIVSLAGVILLILGLGQLYKRLAKSQGGLVSQVGAGGSAPTGIIEVIGRYPISRGVTLIVIKFDRKVLLLSSASPTRGRGGRSATMSTLCELNDPEDVASILLKARDAEGDTIAQSFEQTLREADGMTDEYLHEMDDSYLHHSPVSFPAPRGEPARTITTDDGDRAELWSSGQQTPAASGVLRKRLSSMRRGAQG